MRALRGVWAGLVLASLWLLPALAMASVTFQGSATQVNTATVANDTGMPRVAMEANGNYIVVWRYGVDGIYARRYDKDGNPLTSEIIVSPVDANQDKSSPDVAVSPDGSWMVVWYAFGNPSTFYWRIWGKCYNANNTVKRDAFQISDSYPFNNTRPSVSADGLGRYAVAWADGPLNDIRVQVFGSNGQAATNQIIANTNFKGGYGEASVAMGGDGQFVVVWNRSHTVYSISGQRFAADGTPVGEEFEALEESMWENQPTQPHVAMNADGKFVVVGRSYNDDTGTHRIQYATFDEFGKKLGGLSAVNSPTNISTYRPFAAITGTGDVVATWEANVTGTSSSDGAWIRQFSGDASSSHSAQRITDESTVIVDSGPGVGISPDGTSGVVAWEHNDNIWMQRFSTASVVQFKKKAVTVSENAGSGELPFSVVRTQGTGTLSVTVTGTGGTATAGASGGAGIDYGNGILPLTVNFADGETEKQFALPLFDDSDLEGNETVELTLAAPGGILYGQNRKTTFTISDNEESTVQFTAGTYEFDEPGTVLTSEVKLSRTGTALEIPVQVKVELGGGTGTATGRATAGIAGDYKNDIYPMMIDFAANQTEVVVPIVIFDNSNIETAMENFFIQVKPVSPVQIGLPSVAEIKIYDDEIVLELSQLQTSISEGNSGTKNITFTIGRSGATSRTSTVEYALTGGTLGVDFDAPSFTQPGISESGGTITFAPGATLAYIVVPIRGNLTKDPNRVITCTLSNPLPAPGTRISNLTSVGTTINDDDSAPVVKFGASTYTFAESPGGATSGVLVQRIANTNNTTTVTVNLQTSTGLQATPGVDFDNAAFPLALTFNPGETSKTVPLTVNDDAAYEGGTESFRMALTITDGVSVLNSPSITTISITENDSTFTTATGPSPVVEGDSGTTVISQNVNRGGARVGVSKVDISLGGTATAGVDYTGPIVSGTGVSFDGTTITFQENATQAVLDFTVIGERFDEASETITVELVNPQPSTANTLTGTVLRTLTITDDDTGRNDPPDVGGGSGGTVDGGGHGFTFTPSMFAVDDVDSPDTAILIKLVTTPTTGVIQRTSKSVAVTQLGAGDGFTLQEVGQGAISFAYASIKTADLQDTFTYTVQDESAVPSAPQTFTITIPNASGVQDWRLLEY